MLNQNGFVDLKGRIVALNTNSVIDSNFFSLLWQHTPRALLFCSEFKPEAVMTRQVEKICSGWRFPQTAVPMLPEIYDTHLGFVFVSPLVQMVNQSDVCLKFNFDRVDGNLLMSPYSHDFNLDPDEALLFQGHYKECQWLEYQRLIRRYRSQLEDDQQRCLFNFQDYIEYLKTPEDRLQDLCGCRFCV